MRESTVDKARGRWAGILPALGIPESFVNGKHQPCPLCGGKDRARFTNLDGNGTYYCGQCGPGNGFQLLMKFNNWDFKEAAKRIDGVVGSVKETKLKKPDEKKQRDAMNSVWKNCRKIRDGDPVHLWLKSRLGAVHFSDSIRYAESISYRADPVTHHPCMIAMLHDKNGKPCNLHRTYLTMDGKKADVEQPRKMMPGKIPDGAAVRLMPVDGVVGIAEGIETAYAASRMFNVPCWAATNEVMLRKFSPPNGVREVWVFGDNDKNFVGQAAAYELARTLTRDGITVDVRIPHIPGFDWNDVSRGA